MSMSQWEGGDKPYNTRDSTAGWDIITDPLALMFYGFRGNKDPHPGDKTYSKGPLLRSTYGGQPGLAPPPPATGRGFHFSAGGGGGTGSGSAAGGSASGTAYTLPETLSPIGTTGSTAGLGYTPSAL